MAKIFGIGLSRTGSKSLTAALRILGCQAVHFPTDPVTQGEYFRFFAEPTETLRLSLLDRYDGVTDNPVSCVYRQLDRAYPGSKFILTVRGRESWLRSCQLWWDRFVVPVMENDDAQSIWSFMRLAGMVTYGTPYFDAMLFSQAYEAHMEAVTEYFHGRDRDLLILDICSGEGWQQLAPFIGAPVPDVSFPHRNGMIPAPDRKLTATSVVTA
jgi:sulfotransferase family protein